MFFLIASVLQTLSALWVEMGSVLEAKAAEARIS